MGLCLLTLLCSVGSIALVQSNQIISPRAVFESPHVFITLNAESSVDEHDNLLNRMIEVNWYNVEVDPNNWIGLFKEDPSAEGQSPDPIIRITPTSVEGSVKTPVRLEVIDFHTVELADECLGYWVAYFNGDSQTSTRSNCLRVYPHWMNDLKGVIGDTPLTRLMIPGTHNSGAWKVYVGKEDDVNLATKYNRNQEDDIYTQLMHGIRYFDLRIGFYPETPERFWLNHGVFRLQPFMLLVNDVKKFVMENNEIVLLDFHNFPVGFGNPGSAEFEELRDLLEEELGDFFYRRSSNTNPTLNQIWNSGKCVFVSGENFELFEQPDFLWPEVNHDWGDKNKVDELEEHFELSLPALGCRGQLFSTMAELTPTVADIILQPYFGLRGFAQMVNVPVTRWFRRPAWYSLANIVSTDYYLGNNIIEMAIAVNSNGATCV